MLNTFDFFPSASAIVTISVPAEALPATAAKVFIVAPTKLVAASASHLLPSSNHS